MLGIRPVVWVACVVLLGSAGLAASVLSPEPASQAPSTLAGPGGSEPSAARPGAGQQRSSESARGTLRRSMNRPLDVDAP